MKTFNIGKLFIGLGWSNSKGWTSKATDSSGGSLSNTYLVALIKVVHSDVNSCITYNFIIGRLNIFWSWSKR